MGAIDVFERVVEGAATRVLDAADATVERSLEVADRSMERVASGLFHVVSAARHLRDAVAQPLADRIQVSTGRGCFETARVFLWAACAVGWAAWAVLVFDGRLGEHGLEPFAIIVVSALSARAYQLDRSLVYLIAERRDPDDDEEIEDDDVSAAPDPLRWARFRDDMWAGSVVPMATLAGAALVLVCPPVISWLSPIWILSPLVAFALVLKAASLFLLTCEDVGLTDGRVPA